MFCISTFYKIFPLSNEDSIKIHEDIKGVMEKNDIKGTVLIGVNEGINATIAGLPGNINTFYEYIRNTEILKDLSFKESYHATNPFDKIKVKIKKEIVTMKCDVSFEFTGKKGNYIKPADWDEFISRNDVFVLDTRNDYEYHIGTFENAINPEIDNFRDLPKWLEDNKHLYQGKKLATFCTGGIRCEKLTAYMVQTYFPETYHLEGGIIGYFQETGNINKKWQGHCFVFDNRIAINDKLDAI